MLLAAVACLLCIALSGASLLLLLLAVRPVLAWRNRGRRRAVLSSLGISHDDRLLVGLFHPYCNAGGGGERVLWAAVACLQREEPKAICLIYTGDVDASKSDIVSKVKARFSIVLDPARLHLVYLKSRYLIEDTTWRHFTLIGQSIGSIYLGHEALMAIMPDVFIDTMGYAFTFPLAKFYANIPVGGYVHYPTISTDMLQRVRQRFTGHTNKSAVAKSTLLSNGKLIYYLAFARLYAYCLKQADCMMVNSSWTQAHVNSLIGGPTLAMSSTTKQVRSARIVYPSCDTHSLASLPPENREKSILSLAQFRPEKEQATQLRALKAYLDRPQSYEELKLYMAGSVRNTGDENRVEHLKRLAKELGIEDNVEFVINQPFSDLLKLFERASIGLSTMVDEHFGINVVEFMAAGLIPLVHASGGPLLDIVVPDAATGQPTGFHAKTPDEYADHLERIFEMSEEDQHAMRQRARMAAQRKFSEAEFQKGWMETWRSLIASKASL